MLNIVFNYYKRQVLNQRKNYIKLAVFDKIILALLCAGGISLVLAVFLEKVFDLGDLPLKVMLGGMADIVVMIALGFLSNYIYWKKESRIKEEKDWEQKRIQLLENYLREYLKENQKNKCVDLYQKEVLKFLADECERNYQSTSGKTALFGGVIGFLAGILSSSLDAAIQDLSGVFNEEQRLYFWIIVAAYLLLFILVLVVAGLLINDLRERHTKKIKMLQSDLNFLVAAFENI